MNVRLPTHVLRSEIVRKVFIVTVSNLCLYCHSKSMFGDGQGKGKKGILTSKVIILWPYPGRRMTLPEWQFFHRNMLSLILKRLAWDVCQDDLERYNLHWQHKATFFCEASWKKCCIKVPKFVFLMFTPISIKIVCLLYHIALLNKAFHLFKTRLFKLIQRSKQCFV